MDNLTLNNIYMLVSKQRIEDGAAPVLPLVKRRKGTTQQPSEEGKDEQVVTESSLNKLVGAADVYDLEVGTWNAYIVQNSE